MKRATRRDFLKSSMIQGLAFGLPGLVLGSARLSQAAGPNAEVMMQAMIEVIAGLVTGAIIDHIAGVIADNMMGIVIGPIAGLIAEVIV